MLKNKYYVISAVLIFSALVILAFNVIQKSSTKVPPTQIKKEYLGKQAEIPLTPEHKAKLILQYLNDGKNDLAIKLAKEYLQSNPNDTSIINALTEAYINKDDSSPAEDTVKKAIAMKPNEPWSCRLLAQIYRLKALKNPTTRSANLALALEQIERGLTSNPDDVRLLVEAAQVYSTQGDKVKANEKIDRALSIDPKNADIRFMKEKMNPKEKSPKEKIKP